MMHRLQPCSLCLSLSHLEPIVAALLQQHQFPERPGPKLEAQATATGQLEPRELVVAGHRRVARMLGPVVGEQHRDEALLLLLLVARPVVAAVHELGLDPAAGQRARAVCM